MLFYVSTQNNLQMLVISAKPRVMDPQNGDVFSKIGLYSRPKKDNKQ